MIVTVDHDNPTDGAASQHLLDVEQAEALLEAARSRPPSFLEFRGRRYKLLIGVAKNCGCAQFSELCGDPPYQMAVSSEANIECASTAIVYGMDDSPTEIAPPFNLPITLIAEIAKHFVRTETRSSLVDWEEV